MVSAMNTWNVYCIYSSAYMGPLDAPADAHNNRRTNGIFRWILFIRGYMKYLNVYFVFYDRVDVFLWSI